LTFTLNYYCNVQFEDDEEKLQQIRGLGTDIALVNFSLFTFTGSRPIVIFIGMVVMLITPCL